MTSSDVTATADSVTPKAESETPSVAITATSTIIESFQPLHVIFLHLDWGIGGAEQLMLQLCVASVAAGHTVELVTSRCDQSHCFALLKDPQQSPHSNETGSAATSATNSTTSTSTSTNSGGSLYPYLHVWGQWIPSHIWGKGQALLSTVRLLYLAYWVARKHRNDTVNNNSNTLIVTDVLPTPLWILRYCTSASLLFYCHFPDQLLIRTPTTNTYNNDDGNGEDSSGHDTVSLRRLYRNVLNALEESSMRLADSVTVNSKFTEATVRATFSSFRDTPLPVLYPALDVAGRNPTLAPNKNPTLLVSLNRFERKKNLCLLIHAAAWMHEQTKAPANTNVATIQIPTPTIVIAGGYDPRNVENVEYRAELGLLAQSLNVAVDFRPSISDAERQHLLATALVVVYTPTNEHFGIVPLEAMWAETAVVASQSGGPMETVVSGVTGLLCDADTPESFGAALADLLCHPDKAVRMGQAGRRHVEEKFMPERLQREWTALVDATVQRGRKRQASRTPYIMVSPQSLMILWEALVVGIVCIALTILLKLVRLLPPEQSILGGVRTVIDTLRGGGDEL